MTEIEGTDAGITASETQATETAESVDNNTQTNTEETATPEEIKQVLKNSGMDTSSIPDKPDVSETEEELPDDSDGKDNKSQKTETAKEEPKPTVTDKPDVTTDEPKFTLEVEDANGNKFEISKIEDLPRDFELKDNVQGLEILDKIRELKEQKSEYEKTKQTETEKADQAQRVARIQEGWQNEFKELSITEKADQDKVFEYMRAENAKREEQSRPLIATIEDAKNGMDAQAARDAAKEAAKAEKEEMRRKGGLVGGGSAAPSNNVVPQYRGGATNAIQAAKSMGLL